METSPEHPQKPVVDVFYRSMRGDNLHRYGVSTPTETDWQDEAACRGSSSVFLFESGLKTKAVQPQIQAALAICHSCPVLDQCREWASKYQWVGTVVAGRVYDNYK